MMDSLSGGVYPVSRGLAFFSTLSLRKNAHLLELTANKMITKPFALSLSKPVMSLPNDVNVVRLFDKLTAHHERYHFIVR